MAKNKITLATRLESLKKYIEANRPITVSEWTELHERMQKDPKFRLEVRTKARRKACLRQADEIYDFINKNGYELPKKDLDMFLSWAEFLKNIANYPSSSLEFLTEGLNDCRSLLLSEMFRLFDTK